MPSAKARDFQKVATSLGFLLDERREATNIGSTRTAGFSRFPFMAAKKSARLFSSKFLDSLGLRWSNFKSFAEKGSQTDFANMS